MLPELVAELLPEIAAENCWMYANSGADRFAAYGGVSRHVMAETEIYAKLTELFHDIFNDDSIVLSAATTARDIDGWDSLSNIRLILSVETAFRIRLSAAQAASLANLGGLVALIAAKLRARAGA